MRKNHIEERSPGIFELKHETNKAGYESIIKILNGVNAALQKDNAFLMDQVGIQNERIVELMTLLQEEIEKNKWI